MGGELIGMVFQNDRRKHAKESKNVVNYHTSCQIRLMKCTEFDSLAVLVLTIFITTNVTDGFSSCYLWSRSDGRGSGVVS